jgi:hypothetical protein
VSVVGCLIVAYQRPLELQRVLELVGAEKFDRIFVVIDQPKHKTKENLERFDGVVQTSLTFASSRANVEVEVRSTNYGILRNFQDSIAACFQHVDQLCILEDDCIPSVGIREYIDSVFSLPMDSQVKILTLTRPNFFVDFGNFELTHSPLMWGWVVSKQNWNLISSLINEKSSSGLFPFPQIFFQSFLYSAYYRTRNNQLDALDALVAYVFSSYDFLTLIPPKNLVSNIGTGPLATNTILGSTFHHAKNTRWNSSFIRKVPRINVAKIFCNDFMIYRRMNGWKIHHLFSNYLKIHFLSK